MFIGHKCYVVLRCGFHFPFITSLWSVKCRGNGSSIGSSLKLAKTRSMHIPLVVALVVCVDVVFGGRARVHGPWQKEYVWSGTRLYIPIFTAAPYRVFFFRCFLFHCSALPCIFFTDVFFTSAPLQVFFFHRCFSFLVAVHKYFCFLSVSVSWTVSDADNDKARP